MPHDSKRPVPERALSVLILLIILAYLAVFALINFPGFSGLASADVYADTLVARFMWEEKTLFPKSFSFGNQFYIVATPVVASLFYGLTGSMNLSMALASSLMSVLILVSLDRLLRLFVKERCLRLGAMLVLMSCVFAPNAAFEESDQLFFTFASFYSCYLICFFVIADDYLRSIAGGGKRPAELTLALLLAFATGMQSLRQTCICMLPVLCCELFIAVSAKLRGESFFTEAYLPSLRRSLLYLASNLAGFFAAELMPVKRNSIFSGQSILRGGSIAEKLSCTKSSFSSIIGLDYVRTGSVFFGFIFAFFIALLLASAIILIRSPKKVPRGAALGWLICLIAILGSVAASFVSAVNLRPIYLFMYYPLLVFSFVIVAKRLNGRLRTITVLCLCLLAALNIRFSYGDTIRDITHPAETSPEEEIILLAEDRNCDIIYGQHSITAPIIALRSDGELTAVGWEKEAVFKLSPYLNPRYFSYLSDYTRGLYVFLEEELAPALSETEASGAELSFLGCFGPYHVYSSDRQLVYPLSDFIDYDPDDLR